MIEIPLCSEPVSAVASGDGARNVHRLKPTTAHYPGNYGVVPETVMPDGEPCEVLVVGSVSVLRGTILRSRPIGLMTLVADDGSQHIRLLAVPKDRQHPLFIGTDSVTSLPMALLDQVSSFFTTVRDHTPGPPLQLERWGDAEEAATVIAAAVTAHRQQQQGGWNRGVAL